MAVTLRMLLPCTLRCPGAARELHPPAHCVYDSHRPLSFAARSSVCPTARAGVNREWASSSGHSRAQHCRKTDEDGAITLPGAVPCSASRVLQELFGMTVDQCHGLLPHLSAVPTQTLLDTCLYLKERGVQREQLLRIPWILLKDKGSIQMRLAVLLSGQTMFESPAHGLAFCQFALPTLRNFRSLFHVERLELPLHRNRVYFMADQLEVTVPEMTEAVACIRRFGSVSLEHILDVMERISKLELPGDNVLRDPWIFLENISLDRPSVQEFTVEYYRTDGASLGPGIADRPASSANLIREDLFVHLLAHLKMKISSVSLRKARAVMDLLLREGYTLTEILQNPRVLNFSWRRISERLSLLRAAELPKVSTSFLYYPESRFDACFYSLVGGKEPRTSLLSRAPFRSELHATPNQLCLLGSPKKGL